MKRAILATTAAIAAWTVQDILIWQRYFDGRPWSQSADLYQWWHQAALLALIVAGMYWIRGPWSLWFAGATWTLANSGLPDILYYWLQLRPMPTWLPWLDVTHPLIIFHPASSATIVASSMLWIAGWAFLAELIEVYTRKQKITKR